MRIRSIVILVAAIWPASGLAQACPTATDSESAWLRQSSAEFAVSFSAPAPFQVKNWTSRSDTVSLLFSLWRDAATRVEFFSPDNGRSTAVRDAVGANCILQTALGPIALKTWISHGVQYNGRDTTYYNAGGEITLDHKQPMLIHAIAHDSATLLVTLQILKTLKRNPPL